MESESGTASASLRRSPEARPDPDCDCCHGTGEYFGHAENCRSEWCALNGDYHSCAGQVFQCDCDEAER